MDLYLSIKLYILNIINEAGPGMKIFVMDKDTTGCITVSFSKSEILQREVYLFENLENKCKDQMGLLKCIAILRPTEDNFRLLASELLTPNYGSYFIYFTNIISKSDIKVLAQSDRLEVIRDIQECFADFIPIASCAFYLNIPHSYENAKWIPRSLKRSVDGLTALCLALRLRPAIKYQGNSEMCLKLAENFHKLLSKESELFDFRQSDTPLLLIMDRRYDAVTPLLNQWTYQAMVHQLLGIKNDRVNLSTAPNIPVDLQEVVLSSLFDEFFSENMYLNFGEIGQNIKILLEKYQTKTKNQQQVDSIADMKKFIENYPEFKKLSGTVSKHIAVVGELSRLVAENNLLEVSELEQNMSAPYTFEHAACLSQIQKVIMNEKTTPKNALVLVLLYALYFENNSSQNISKLSTLLRRKGGLTERDLKHWIHVLALNMWERIKVSLPILLHSIIAFGGQNFVSKSCFEERRSNLSLTQKYLKGIKGVENIYTQHTPLLSDILDSIYKSKLNELSYPYFGSSALLSERPSRIVVFIVGGITYEEVLAVNNFNNLSSPVQAVIGGTEILNTSLDLFMQNCLIRGLLMAVSLVLCSCHLNYM